MEQLTLVNIILVITGLLINVLGYFQNLKKENKPFRLDIVAVLSGIVGFLSAFAGLVMAKDLFVSSGVTMADDAPLYTIHAFVCGLLPNVIIDKAKSFLFLLKRQK